MTSLQLSSLPDLVWRKIANKVSAETFSNITRTNKKVFVALTTSTSGPFMPMESIVISKNRIVIKKTPYREMRKNWLEIVSCGYRFKTKKLEILAEEKTLKRVKDTILMFTETSIFVDVLELPKKLDEIPIDLVNKLIRFSKPQRIIFHNLFTNFHITEIVPTNTKTILSVFEGENINDDDFLALTSGLEIREKHQISPWAISQKIKKYRSDPSLFCHFSLYSRQEVPEEIRDLVEQLGPNVYPGLTWDFWGEKQVFNTDVDWLRYILPLRVWFSRHLVKLDEIWRNIYVELKGGSDWSNQYEICCMAQEKALE